MHCSHQGVIMCHTMHEYEEFPLDAGDNTHKQGIQPGPETQGRFYQKSDIWVSVVSQKWLITSKNFVSHKQFQKVWPKTLNQ